MGELRVYVELPEELDVGDWSVRYGRNEVPDYTPYGLHKIAGDGISVDFRRPLAGHWTAWVATKVRNLVDGTELVGAALEAPRRARRTADVVLCMDERTGLPAALTPLGPPVVSGIAWLERPQDLRWAHAAAARRAMARMAAVFTQSPAMAPVLRETWGLPECRVHNVTLGIDERFYAAQPWPGEDGLIVSVGDDRMRRHELLIDAVRQLRVAGVPARLELATTQRVDLPGELGVLHARRMGAAMRGMYRRAIVVAVALHPTNLGSGLTVVLEAMASARPIVVTGNPGLDAYVEHNVTGMLVPAEDSAAFADALGYLLTDPTRARAMGEAGRAAVERSFTTAHMAEQLRGLLRSVTPG